MGPDDYYASIGLTASNFAPINTAFCWGQIMSISQNNALFALLGTTYGGDGVSTYKLPDLRGAVPVGAGTASNGETYVQGATEPLALASFSNGQPEKATAVPTQLVNSGAAGLALNYAITLAGIWPPRP